MDPIWRLELSDPNGLNPRYENMGILKIDGSPSMNVNGDGDCQECTFGGIVDIGPRDRVRVQWSVDGGATWRNRYTGIALQNRSQLRDDQGNYKLMGLSKKLDEWEARITLAEADLDAQVRQVIRDLINSGQAGQLLTFDDTPAPLGITSGRVVPNYQKVSELFKGTLCPRLERSRVAVNHDGRLIFGVPSGVLALDEADSAVHIDWGDVGSEELVTHLRLIWPKVMGGNLSYHRGLPSDREAVEIAVQNPQNTVASALVSGPSPYPYGQSTATLGVILDSSNFMRPNTIGVEILPRVTQGAGDHGYTVEGDEPLLWDGDRNTVVTLTPDPNGYSSMYLTLSYPPGLPPPIGVEFAGEGGALTQITLSDSQRTFKSLSPGGVGGFFLLPDEVTQALAESTSDTGYVLTLTLDIADSTVPLLLRAAALLWVSPDFAQPLLMAVSRTPVAAAGTVLLDGWPDPLPEASIQRRGPANEPLEVITLPTSYRYFVGLNGDLQTEVLLGQRDKPEDAAAAALVKERDKSATLQAIRVSG